MDKILRINMGADGGPAASTESLGDYEGFGGRGLTSAIVSKEVPPTCHPLGEENKLVIAPGLLSGSTAAMSGRISVGCKSPLTGGIKESNAGGQAAQMLGRLGYAAIVLEGQPKEKNIYKIFVNKDGVATLKLGQARGAAVCAAISHSLPVAEYSPRSVKQAIVGRGSAEKNQVQYMVGMLLNIKENIQADAADALAVALCHQHFYESAQRIGSALPTGSGS